MTDAQTAQGSETTETTARRTQAADGLEMFLGDLFDNMRDIEALLEIAEEKLYDLRCRLKDSGGPADDLRAPRCLLSTVQRLCLQTRARIEPAFDMLETVSPKQDGA